MKKRGSVDRTTVRSTLPLHAALVALITFWLYRSALGFAYFNDDPTGHFAWMEGRTVVDFFSGSAAYGYYRPVVFTALRLFETLFGGGAWPHNPFADHALLVLLHAANAALVWGLAWRLVGMRPGRAAFAWVAALVFAALPFSYEAVAYVASLTHPLVTFFVLVTLLLYRRGSRFQVPGSRGERSPLAPGTWPLAPFFLALLTHETGLLVLPALVGIDWLRRPGDGVGVRLRRLWPYGLAAALFVVLWLAIPKNSAQGLNAPADIGRNAVPFLQTLVFPLLPLLPLLRLDAGDVGLLAALAAVTVAALGLLARWADVGRLWLFALGWVVLAALPSLLFLGPAYVYGSPRLSYLPAVGVGLLWALPALAMARLLADFRGQVPGARFQGKSVLPLEPGPWNLAPAIAVLYLLLLLLPVRPFVACQLDFYAETSRLARAMGDIGGAAPLGQEIVFVNAPFFFSSTAARPNGCPSPYPWTPTGGILIPPYAQAHDFVRFNGGPERTASGVSFAGYAPGWRTFGPEIDGQALRAAVAESAVSVFDLGRGGFADLSAAWRPGGVSEGAARVTFGGALELVGATTNVAGDALGVRLDWRVAAPPPFLPTVFVHVYDTAGALAAQSDGPPAGGFVPVALWQPGDGLSDTRVIDLSTLPPGDYTVAVGVYNPADGARLAAEASNVLLPDNVFVLTGIDR